MSCHAPHEEAGLRVVRWILLMALDAALMKPLTRRPKIMCWLLASEVVDGALDGSRVGRWWCRERSWRVAGPTDTGPLDREQGSRYRYHLLSHL